MTTQKRRFGIALVLLTASILALYPTMTLEKPQQGSAVVSIKADGQAFPNAKGKPSITSSAATLTLTGSVQTKGNGELKLDDLAGSLEIGLAAYTITHGDGEVNKKGKIEINAKTSDADKKLELILHGNTQDDTVAFDSKESKLSSLYFLSLKGQVAVTMPTTNTTTTESPSETVTVTVTESGTTTETVTEIQENTITITESSNQTITETATQTVTEPATTSTITVTETSNQTLTETTTQTVTETLPIVTVTETVTVTFSNSTATATSTNSTQTLP
jgi:hypothetical protein